MPVSTTKTNASFDFRKITQNLLKILRRDRDRQILSRRFGFDLSKRHTLESIGRDFNITRERVRQIEKSAIAKIRKEASAEIKDFNLWLSNYMKAEGYISLTSEVAGKLGAKSENEHPYVHFLAAVSDRVDVLHDELVHHSLISSGKQTKSSVRKLISDITAVLNKLNRPATLDEINANLAGNHSLAEVRNAAKVSRNITSYQDKWGLISWPEVNPKSIRDKTYLILKQSAKPMHFREIAEQIQSFTTNHRNVTVQAVHNELIKDKRFVLIGRGIYALREWGYAPGTVADMIEEVLKDESPLHKDEIVKRVLAKRQVKPTTIILNLQEKDQFERVAKATYKLRGR